MINKIAEEINKALDAELYLIALGSALTLPDICGKAEYPDEKSTAIRYKKWYDHHIGQYEKADDDMPYLSGDIVYSLRCSLLHQGNPNVDNTQMHLDEFQLLIQRMEGIEIYIDTSSVVTHADGSETRSYKVHIKNLCWMICRLAQKYYNKNKDKFNFFNYKIVDLDKMFPIKFSIK